MARLAFLGAWNGHPVVVEYDSRVLWRNWGHRRLYRLYFDGRPVASRLRWSLRRPRSESVELIGRPREGDGSQRSVAAHVTYALRGLGRQLACELTVDGQRVPVALEPQGDERAAIVRL